MVPLYAARIEDLGPGDFVKVECAACGHDVLIPPNALLQGLRLQPTDRVLDLEPRFRCRECDGARQGDRVGEVGPLGQPPADPDGAVRAPERPMSAAVCATRNCWPPSDSHWLGGWRELLIDLRAIRCHTLR